MLARVRGRGRRLRAQPARQQAHRLPARRADLGDARPPQARRRHRGAGHDHARQPDVPGHGSPDLQRLHEGLHLPEAGSRQHPADRDRHPHRRLEAAVRLRDLQPPHALQPAEPRAALRPALPRPRRHGGRARAGGLHLEPLPGQRRLRRRRHRRAQARARGRRVDRAWAAVPGADSGLRDTQDRARRADPHGLRGRVGVRHHRPLGQDVPRRDLPHASPAAERALLRRRAVRRDAGHRRCVAAGLRPRGDRDRGRQADGHPDEEQPDPRHPQGERLPDGAPAHGRLQAVVAGQPPGSPAGRGDRGD